MRIAVPAHRGGGHRATAVRAEGRDETSEREDLKGALPLILTGRVRLRRRPQGLSRPVGYHPPSTVRSASGLNTATSPVSGTHSPGILTSIWTDDTWW